MSKIKLNNPIDLAGVYQIKNTKNNKIYVGSSKNIQSRWQQHILALERGQHHSVKLQRSYNATKDKSVFELSVLEVVEDITLLKDREQYYIDQLDAFNSGYNCSAEADNIKYTEHKRKKNNLKAEYDRFFALYTGNEDYVNLGPTLRTRIYDRHYKYSAIHKLCEIIAWFVEDYDTDRFTVHPLYKNNTCYAEILDKEGKRVDLIKFPLIKPIEPDIYLADIKMGLVTGLIKIDTAGVIHWNDDPRNKYKNGMFADCPNIFAVGRYNVVG